MSANTPIIYVINPTIAVTGALVASCHAAKLLAQDARMVLVLPEGTSVRAEEVTDFWRVDYLPMVGISKNLHAMLRYVPSLVRGSWKLKQRMAHDGATRIQLNDFYLMHGTLLRLLGFKGHIVSWVRCNPRLFAGPLTWPMLYLVHRSADRIVAVSSFVQSLLAPRIESTLLYDCYMGIARSPRVWGAAEEKPLVYIGNYIRGKGQDMALEAFAIAVAQDPSLQLTFFGGDMGLIKNRQFRAELEARAQQMGLCHRVRFEPFQSNTCRLLEGAFAALNFSVSESFSMTVLEASGAGVPVIATACGGPQEILHDGVTGYLVPVGDVAAAASRILDLARNPERAAAMGQAAADHVHTHFRPDQFRAELKTILEIT